MTVTQKWTGRASSALTTPERVTAAATRGPVNVVRLIAHDSRTPWRGRSRPTNGLQRGAVLPPVGALPRVAVPAELHVDVGVLAAVLVIPRAHDEEDRS